MKEIELRYVAHLTALTNETKEQFNSEVDTIRELISQLNEKYPGFEEIFVQPLTGRINFNAMIYYSERGDVPVSVIDLNHPIEDRSTITFW
jgi:molybdopterin converting factor small subunit